MSNFDEKAGVVYCKTSWGHWGQTIEEVFIEVETTGNVRAKDIKCEIKPKHISLTIKGQLIFEVDRTSTLNCSYFYTMQGNLFATVLKDDSVWTLGSIVLKHNHKYIVLIQLMLCLEDQSLLRIVLVKSQRDASNCWKSLLESQYEINAWELDQMEKKLTLERFQIEARNKGTHHCTVNSVFFCYEQNPGFDFSGAEITGNYHGGGPKLN